MSFKAIYCVLHGITKILFQATQELSKQRLLGFGNLRIKTSNFQIIKFLPQYLLHMPRATVWYLVRIKMNHCLTVRNQENYITGCHKNNDCLSDNVTVINHLNWDSLCNCFEDETVSVVWIFNDQDDAMNHENFSLELLVWTWDLG